MLIAVWFWGIRLTANWAYTFHNLQGEDWRYVMYRERCPKTWHLVNFFGINMMGKGKKATALLRIKTFRAIICDG
jgi:steroid 5-alpha reductase family enzyme